MNNKISIHSDHINLYFHLRIRPNKIGVSVLVFFIILELFTVGFILSGLSKELEGIFFAFLFLAGILFFSFKYFIWNIAGEEWIIVNDRSISYQYQYGFVRTKLKSISFNQLVVVPQWIGMAEREEGGKLFFFDYSEKHGIPEVIHNTTIILPKEVIQEILIEMDKFFINKTQNTSFSLN